MLCKELLPKGLRAGPGLFIKWLRLPSSRTYEPAMEPRPQATRPVTGGRVRVHGQE